jgi:DNA-binding response OmpR family regulator
MPELSGLELFGEIQKLKPGLQERIVFMTGGAFSKGASAFLESVPNRQVEKPFHTNSLRALVRELVR